MSAPVHTPAAVLNDESDLAARLAAGRRLALVVGGSALALSLALAFFAPRVFLPAYLAVYVFVLGISVGSLAFMLLHYLVGGYWGFVIRRPLESAVAVLPLLALLFLPVALAGRHLYAWADSEVVSGSPQLVHKSGYLNIPFFCVRAALYFGLWIVLAARLRRGSLVQDRTESPTATRRTQSIAAPGLVLVFVSTTFAAIDWMMSIEPQWYSSIYGVMVLVGWGLSALTAMTIVSAWLCRNVAAMEPLARPTGFQDLGNLMLAFVMLWAYMSFSQYLIIWSGNLAEEVPWYITRSYGGWRLVCLILMVFHFFVPFFVLLIANNKRDAMRLWKVGAWVLVMQLVNSVWLIIPAFPNHQWAQLVCVIPALAGVGGLWLWAFLGFLTQRPLVPRNDPLLYAALEHAGGSH